jgi:hypothetical protein
LLLKLTGVDLSRCPCCHQGTMIPPAIWRLRSGNLVGTLHEQAILLRALTDFGVVAHGAGVYQPAENIPSLTHGPTCRRLSHSFSALVHYDGASLPSSKSVFRRRLSYFECP